MTKIYDKEDIVSSTNMALNSLVLALLAKHVEKELPELLEQYSIPKEIQEEPSNKKIIEEVKDSYMDSLYDYVWSHF